MSELYDDPAWLLDLFDPDAPDPEVDAAQDYIDDMRAEAALLDEEGRDR